MKCMYINCIFIRCLFGQFRLHLFINLKLFVFEIDLIASTVSFVVVFLADVDVRTGALETVTLPVFVSFLSARPIDATPRLTNEITPRNTLINDSNNTFVINVGINDPQILAHKLLIAVQHLNSTHYVFYRQANAFLYNPGSVAK